MNQAEEIKSKYYTQTKENLIYYRFYVVSIERKEERIQELALQAEGIKGTDYSVDRVQTSPTNLIEKLIAEKMHIEDELRKAKALVADIDRAMTELEEVDKRILEMKYIDKLSVFNNWRKVAREVKYEERQCRRRAEKAIDKIAVVVYGVD